MGSANLLDDVSSLPYEPIAVIGLASRLPGADTSAEKLWTMIVEGQRARSRMPESRVNIDSHYHPSSDRVTTTNVRHANWLDADVAAFDAQFFSIQPFEAESMDPQQRMLLETSYQALENAGIPMERAIGSKTSVYIASTAHDYEIMQFRDPEQMPKYMSTGTAMSLLSNRVSWFFDFRGPSISLDTACSGSLSAMHLACQSLRNRESNMALVGGVSLNLVPEVIFSQLSTLGFLSPDGCSYSFDQRANGYGKGEGLGVVLLKRVSDAVRDGDTIRAVIRSSSINQDGRTPGITQPSKRAQKENILQAYHQAGLSLDHTTFFEAHGTGTAIGDPFEAEAIHSAFQRLPSNPLYIGAFKANIGHLEAGAGIAATIKAVHVLEHGIIPPIAGFETRNPDIPEEWGLKFLSEAIEFPKGLRRLSVNSFGYGGTNAHVIFDDAASFINCYAPGGKHTTVVRTDNLAYDDNIISLNGNSEYREIDDHPVGSGKSRKGNSHLYNGGANGHIPSQSKNKAAVLLFSAADEAGVKRLAEAYEDYFAGKPDNHELLVDLAYTLSRRRSDLPWKAFAVTSGLPRRGFSGTISKPIRSSTTPAISCVFTGQGAQWYGMAHGLNGYPLFWDHLCKSDAYLRSAGCTWKLTDELYKDERESRINIPELAQTLCTAVQIALVDLLRSWGIQFVAVSGHSSGEIAAAYCIGALPHEGAILTAWHRGRVVSKIQAGKGGMMAVALSEEEAQPHLQTAMHRSGHQISIGCVNAPTNVTITGDTQAIDALQEELDERAIFARKLQVDVAYHSHHMEQVAREYETSLTSWKGKPTGTIMFSSVTGSQLSLEDVRRPAYWVRNLVNTVRFADAVDAMTTYLADRRSTSSNDILIEIGPHPALQRPVKDIIGSKKNILYDSLLVRGTDSRLSVANAMGRLRCEGCPIDLSMVSGPERISFQLLTNLPHYVFNHSQSYWCESRASRGLRFRERGRHELLGVREADWNPSLPKWRNVIREAEHPWIRQYQVDSQAQYPAAGLVVMAVEAVRQLSESEPNGYHITNISFPCSFPIPEGALEAQIQLIPREELYDFLIFMNSGEEWVKVCQGSIQSSPSFASTDRARRLHLEGLHDTKKLHRWEKMQGAPFYKALEEDGFSWPPSFQNLDELRFTKNGEALAVTSRGLWRSKIEDAPELASHVIHPSDLDNILQSSIVAYSQAGTVGIPSMLPSKIDSIWIANRQAQTDLRVLARTTFSGPRNAEFSIGAADDQDVCVLVEGYRLTQARDKVLANEPTRQSYKVEWRPDVDLLPSAELESLCLSSETVESPEAVARQELLCLYYMSKAMENAPKRESLPKHLAKYMSWVEHSFDSADLHHLRTGNSFNEKLFHDDTRAEFLTQVEQESCEGKLFRKVGENLLNVLHGKIDALELLYGEDDLANDYFSSTRPRFSSLMSYIDLLAFKKPALKILEVGAGTGSMTGSILQTLLRYTNRKDEHNDIPRLSQYMFTDISSAFFGKAQEQFGQYERYMSYKSLDLERNILDQGFEEGSYDIVVASMTLYATTNLKRTLQNISKALKPDGKLILFECTAPETARAGFSFGLLPGWWLSDEKEREWSPLLSPSSWKGLLQSSGFGEVTIHLPDSANTHSSLIASLKPSETKVEEITTIVATTEQQGLVTRLSKELSNFKLATQAPEQLWNSEIKGHLIILIEMAQDFFTNLTEEQWQGFLRAVWAAKTILWVTTGAATTCANPLRSIITGFGRAIRSEDLDAHFIELALDTDNEKHIANVYRQSLHPHEDLLESEFMERDGQLCIGRLSESVDINRMLFDATGHRRPSLQPFKQERSLQLTATAPGQLDTFCFDDDLGHDEPLNPTEVEIKLEAANISPEDFQIALGELVSDVFGYGCSGIVSRVGKDSPFHIGDRVCACTANGAYKTFVRSESNTVVQIPEKTDFRTAAGLPVCFVTAHYGLMTVAKLQRGESILITDGLSYIGQAAIQVAQQLGTQVFTTCNSEQRATLKTRFDLPESHILEAKSDIASQVYKVTGRGVDVAFHSRQLDLACMAPFGRDIELVHHNATSTQTPVKPNISLHRVDMHSVIKHLGSAVNTSMSILGQLLREDAIDAPQPLQVFPISKISEAFRSLSKSSEGCAVVQVAADDTVPTLPSIRTSYHFHADATYVIAGGLGGLGGAMVEWMAERGARHFLLLSRSGGDGNDIARTFIANMKSRGVQIHAPKCDISNEEHVAAAMDECKKSMPPIRGCIQGAMVLREMLLQAMTAQDVHDVLQPKTLGTLNLDSHLPDSMDFFVLLSSISSLVGFRGIGSYAAANTFLDAFARARASPLRPCLSLDLGAVKSIGVMADRGMTDWLLKEGLESLATAELFALLDWACNPSNPAARSPPDAQLVTGLAGVETMRADHFQGVYWSSKPMLRPLIQCNIAKQGTRQVATEELVQDWAVDLAAASDHAAAQDVALASLIERFARLLAIPRSDVDANKPIQGFGIDSLITMELRQWIKKTLSAEVTVQEMVDSANLHEVAGIIAGKTTLRSKE